MKFSRVLLPVALALAASAAFTPHSLSAQGGGVYTAAQAQAGATVFAAQCSACHGSKLEGISAPPLAGNDFISKWTGQTADDLRDVVATQMPMTDPGSLKPADVLAVVAYILQQNKYPAGDTALTAAKTKSVKIAKQS